MPRREVPPQYVTDAFMRLFAERYECDREAMAKAFHVRTAYLGLFIDGKRMPPVWMLDRLGIERKSKRVHTYYIKDDR